MKTITCEFCGKAYNANQLECPENCYNECNVIIPASNQAVTKFVDYVANEYISPFDDEDMTLILLGINDNLIKGCAEKETAQLAIDIRNKIYQLRDRLIFNQ